MKTSYLLKSILLVVAAMSTLGWASKTKAAAWTGVDVGTVGIAGTQTYTGSSNSWSISGAGTGVTGTADSFHYVYQTSSGNSVALAHVTSLSTSTTSCGVAIRQSLTAGSAEAAILLNSTNGISFLTRSTSGGSLTTTPGLHVSAPYWLKVVRFGSAFYGYESSDGLTWTQVGTTTITMTGTVYAGIVATSGTTSSLSVSGVNNATDLPPSNYLSSGAVFSGASHNFFLQSTGNVWAWGLNINGQLGVGSTTNQTSPVQITTLSSMQSLSGGGAHSLGLKSDGTVWAWGLDSSGQLGDSGTTQQNSPESLTTLSAMAAVSAGSYHSLALKSDGTVWAWGLNSNGQLGDGTNLQRTAPEQLTSLSGIVAIAAGSSHSLALRDDGTVWAWGYNGLGQLGDTTTTDRWAPVQVSGLSSIVAIAAGSNFSAAIKSDGTVWTWGDDSCGQLGDGSSNYRATAYEVQLSGSNLTNASALAAGAYHLIIQRGDGSLVAMGANYDAQLGDGTTTNRATPEVLTGLTGIVSISAGQAHSVVFNGTVITNFGDNSLGQLGTGTIGSISLNAYDSDGNGLPDWWEIKYFGQLGNNGAALAPNGSGLTILQCYQNGVSPIKAAPLEPFTIAISATGPYQAPASPLVVTAITHPSTTTIAHVDFYNGTTLLGSTTSAPWQLQFTSLAAGNYAIKAIAYDNTGATVSATTQFTVTPSNFYTRGSSYDNVDISTIVAVGMEKGQLLDGMQGTDPANNFSNLYPASRYPLYPWFLRTQGGTNELWQHITAVKIASVNNATGVLTAATNPILNQGQVLNAAPNLQVGQTIVISGATGDTAINGTFKVASVPAVGQFTITTTTGGAVTLSGTYTANSGSITYSTFNVLPTAAGAAVGGAPPLVAFGSQGGGTPLYVNQSYNFGVAAGGQLAFAPITISGINNTSGVLTTATAHGLHVGQMIVISGATGDTVVNGTFLVGTVPASNQLTLQTPSGGAVTLTGTYTANTGLITNADIKVEVYLASAFASGSKIAPVYTQAFTVPRASNTTAWNAFVANGYVQDYLIGTVNGMAINFDTQVQIVPGAVATSTWMQQVDYPLEVTHKAANLTYYYKVSYMGVTAPDDATAGNFGTTVPSVSTDSPMGVDSTGVNQVWNVSYTLDFSASSPWQSAYIVQPQFQGAPLPSAYQGQSVDELIHNAPPVTDTLDAPGSTALNNLGLTSLGTVDASPELRDHPVLDQLVTSMNSDPMALANYVLNQINLTDAVGYDTATGQISDTSINPQGVSRDALATYLEGQGSPVEQDALLIYLLRKAGYSCAYVFPQQDQTLMFDEQLSKLLRMQIRGAETPAGGQSVPELIPVNYPWVAAYIGGKWVHIFPWLKDTSVTEGNDIWNYLPSGYQTGGQWLLHYILNDPTIRQLKTPDGLYTDDVNTLFPLYVQNQLKTTGLSIDQVGTNIYNRQNYYTSWTQFPHPWQTPTIADTNLAQSLTASQNPAALSTALTNIFDTISIQVLSDRNGNGVADAGEPVMNTGTLRMVDLHDRRFMLYPQVVSATGTNAPTYNLILSLEPYSSTRTAGPYTFNGTASYTNSGGTTITKPDNGSGNPGDLMNQQYASIPLQTTSTPATNDDSLLFQITYNRHIQAQSIPNINTLNQWATFLGVSEVDSISDTRYLRKGDMACLCLNYGTVSQKMMEFQAEKYWNYQQTVAANPSTPANPELAEGQLLYIMGETYYNKVSTLEQNVEGWTKTHAISWFAHGITKLSPYRNSDGSPNLINGAVNLRYPRVDMAYQEAAWVGNGTTNLNSGDEGNLANNSADELVIGGGSADEHIVLNEFFQQASAISTVKLLDIAQGWTPTTQIASHPGTGPVVLNSSNYTSLGSTTLYPGNSGNGTFNHTLEYWCGWTNTSLPVPAGSIWAAITATLSDPNNGPLSTVYVTPGPQTAPGQAGQAYTGVGALTLGVGSYGAYITDNMVINNGGYGGDPNIEFSDASSTTVSSSISSAFTGSMDLTYTPDGGMAISYNGNNSSTAASYIGSNISVNNDVNIGTDLSGSSLILTPDGVGNINNFGGQVTIGTFTALGSSGAATGSATLQMDSSGNIGPVDYLGDVLSSSGATSQSPLGGIFASVYDPVNAMTGEFYVNASDIKLNGPMPLEIHRIYGSLNQADNNFGHGWRMSYFPYLMLSNDAVYNTANTQLTTPPTLIYAAEMDGSVICYTRQTSPNTRWIPMTSAATGIPVSAGNPGMVNSADGKVGGTANPFNNRIDETTVGGNTVFTLTGADGSVRTFTVQAYPTIGSSSISRARPYLQKWVDNRGNYYTFGYGTSNTATDYGQVNRIQASNGNYIGFVYDTYGHITQAFTGDGRNLFYQYDGYGDLTQVTLPDASTIGYTYQHATAAAVAGTAVAGNGTYTANSANIASDNSIIITAATNASPSVITTSSAHGLQVGQLVVISGAVGNTAINGSYTVGTVPSGTTLTLLKGATAAAPYSTHLIVQETKPDGRILQNTYSSTNNYAARQVVTQLATVGTNETLVQNASFNYGTPTKNSDGTITGTTIITDVNGNTTTYKYAESQITEVDYPSQNGSNTGQLSNGPKSLQTWYTTTGSGAYQRSLATTTDKRGLVSTYTYDSNGNLLTLKLTGNLTGGSVNTETSTTTMTYNSSTAVNLPGGGTAVPNTLLSTSDQLSNGATYVYGDTAHPYAPTSITKKGAGTAISTTLMRYQDVSSSGASAYGVLSQQTLAAGTSDEATTQYTYTDGRGFPSSQTQSTGTSDPAVTMSFTYDLRGELTSQTDSAGQRTQYTYDARGHRIGAERYDQWGNLESWNYSYYNQNGDLEWEQGPRYSPNDYVYKYYDGAGRLSQEIKCLSAPLLDGSGVTSNGFATTTNTYDTFGNLTEVDNPNQNATTMTYDAEGEMKTQVVHQGANSGPAISSESFTYEAGGQVATHTSMLGGLETRAYTYTGEVKSDALPDGSTKSYTYDLTGRVVKETLANSSYWTTTYNDATLNIARAFYNSAGTQLMTESQTFDRRGNVVSKTDVSGNTFTTKYDALNRVKSATGPATAGTTAQQTVTHSYDAAGLVHTVTNGTGEKTITYMDAEGRPTLVSVFNHDGTTASNTGFWYSPDHQSVVQTVGSGAAGSADPAVTTTTFTDTNNRPVLVLHGDGKWNATIYDPLGNKLEYVDEMGAATNWSYDALNRPLSESLPASSSANAAVTNFTYTLNSPTGETVSRAMPEGLTAKTTYNSAGLETEEELDGTGSTITRKYTYTYYTSGAIGKLYQVVDPRGFTTTTTYDAWLRPSTVNSTGGAATQDQDTTYGYDNRGMVSSVTQNYATAATGASTQVTRGYDGYGQMNAETTYLNSAGTTTFTSANIISQWAQSWDGTGRRTALNSGITTLGTATGTYGYQYNASGLLTQVTQAGVNYTYAYGDDNLLESRTSPLRTQTITSRDSRGRITAENSTSAGTTQLTETMNWRNDDRLSSYSVNGPIVSTESRSYSYDIRGRVTTEPYYLATSTQSGFTGQQTATYQFDNNILGGTGGLGFRTLQSVDSGSYGYQVETVNSFSQPTGDYAAPLNIAIGTLSSDTLTFTPDSAGNTTSRVATTYQTQNMTWDSYNRLINLSVPDISGSYQGYTWATVYDGFGRRVQTTYQVIGTNGLPSGTPATITYYYDPQVEFLELGQMVTNTSNSPPSDRTWRVYGPDRSGVYGGAQGIGGIDNEVDEAGTWGNVPINNYFGDTVGESFVPTVVSPGYYETYGYGSALGGYGYEPGSSVYSLTTQWRGHYFDYTGLVYMGARYYEPASGRFLSADPFGNASSMGLYDYCNGDPVNALDPNGEDALYFAGAGNAENNSGAPSWSGKYSGFYDAAQKQAASYMASNPGQLAYVVKVASASDVQNALNSYANAGVSIDSLNFIAHNYSLKGGGLGLGPGPGGNLLDSDFSNLNYSSLALNAVGSVEACYSALPRVGASEALANAAEIPVTGYNQEVSFTDSGDPRQANIWSYYTALNDLDAATGTNISKIMPEDGKPYEDPITYYGEGLPFSQTNYPNLTVGNTTYSFPSSGDPLSSQVAKWK